MNSAHLHIDICTCARCLHHPLTSVGRLTGHHCKQTQRKKALCTPSTCLKPTRLKSISTKSISTKSIRMKSQSTKSERLDSASPKSMFLEFTKYVCTKFHSKLYPYVYKIQLPPAIWMLSHIFTCSYRCMYICMYAEINIPRNSAGNQQLVKIAYHASRQSTANRRGFLS